MILERTGKMSNKLKSIFSKENDKNLGKIKFSSRDGSKQFLESIKQMYKDGKPVKIDNIESIKAYITDDFYSIPILESKGKDIEELFIAPAKIKKSVTLNNGRVFNFRIFQTEDKVILETYEDSIISLRIELEKEEKENNVHLDYKLNPDKAKKIVDIIESCNDTIAFLIYFFEDDSIEISFLDNLLEVFSKWISVLEKLDKLSRFLDISFDLSKITTEDYRDLEILYALLIEKQCFRYDKKFESSNMPISNNDTNKIKSIIGEKIDLTFTAIIDFEIYGEKIRVYIAQLLSNAILENFEVDDDTIRLFYTDTDSEPMYVSYSGFKSEKECNEEMSKIIQNKKKYLNALTVEEYFSNLNKAQSIN